ncbi:MAG TPA: cyclic nucleotide-binding domain-containing protein [Terrimicrobiaceae bacterium]
MHFGSFFGTKCLEQTNHYIREASRTMELGARVERLLLTPEGEHLTSEEARDVTGLLGTIDLKSGETLFRQGDPCTAVYLVISGEVQIRIEASDQPPRTLVTLGPGAILGEMGPLTDEPRGATSIALKDTQLAQLPISALKTGLERGDRWATKFVMATARVLAQRLAALNKEAISVMAQLEKSKSKAPAEDELERPSAPLAYGVDVLTSLEFRSDHCFPCVVIINGPADRTAARRLSFSPGCPRSFTSQSR